MDTFLQKYLDITQINASFSFAPYYRFLKKRIDGTDDVKRRMFQYFASRIEEAGVQERDLSADEISGYKELLDILYVSLTNITIDGDKDLWGITAPFTSTFAYGTPSLYRSFVEKDTGWLKPEFESNFKEIGLAALKNIYHTILDQLYGIANPSKDEFIYRYIDNVTGLYRFFKINFGHDFIDMRYNNELPELSERMIAGITEDDVFVRYMLRKLPLTGFEFRGFGVVTIADVTQQQIMVYIKERLWKLKDDVSCIETGFEDLRLAVKSLLGSNKIEIGAMPFIMMNGRMVRKAGEGLVGASALTEQEVQTFFKTFEAGAKPVVVDDIATGGTRHPLVEKILKGTPYRTYAAMPIFYQQKVYGVVELFATEPGLITAERIKLLERLYIELAQLMKVGHEMFENDIRSVISDRFTVIQPSVAWKFDDVALAYLQQQKVHGKVIQKVPIVFESVYPFYGAVDIRNSSLIRNNAIRADWQLQLQWLRKTANELAQFNLPYIQQLMQQQIEFLKDNNVDQPISSETISTSNALDKVLRKLLGALRTEQPETAAICNAYLDAIDLANGSCSINRRNLDMSMQQAIAGIDTLLDEMNSRMQEVSPAYYNKFRTDGIEYDLYVGSAINPQKPFSSAQLHELHIIQLEYMRKVALANAAQQHALLVPLQSTQLIFVNSDVIDITFREDEKRFDVEGAYNIRYQMIKKRIDKVHLRDSEERLTQPGKIAVVYINEADVEDYKTLLEEQVKKGLFVNLEHLQLEDLQGISGLKALRVTVNEN
ncbi:GAF domain-containing protein [Niabella sp. 22666]|uniref:GAF domain-containing protein n=1 Tax=Niabella sp. 22666 TaxID=3453954 RepID=UPI003F8563F6